MAKKKLTTVFVDGSLQKVYLDKDGRIEGAPAAPAKKVDTPDTAPTKKAPTKKELLAELKLRKIKVKATLSNVAYQAIIDQDDKDKAAAVDAVAIKAEEDRRAALSEEERAAEDAAKAEGGEVKTEATGQGGSGDQDVI